MPSRKPLNWGYRDKNRQRGGGPKRRRDCHTGERAHDPTADESFISHRARGIAVAQERDSYRAVREMAWQELFENGKWMESKGAGFRNGHECKKPRDNSVDRRLK